MKKIVSVVLASALALSVTACGNTQSTADSNSANSVLGSNSGSSQALEDQNMQLTNPFIDCDSIEQAAETAGFEMTVGELSGYQQGAIRAVKDKMVELHYTGENGTRVMIRKGVGTEDISGDYNSYAEEKEIEVSEKTVTLKGNGGMVNLAVWTDGTYGYAVSTDGIDEAVITAIVGDIQ